MRSLFMGLVVGILLGRLVAAFGDKPFVQIWQDDEKATIQMRGMGCGDQRFGPFPLDNLRDEDGSDFVCGDIYMRLRIGGNGIQ